jgi:U3 small nucleolar RNA-associated protein 5
MLESCFHVGDLVIVRTTIQRLDSSLAATLLQRLAERLASRPGRFGHLLVWVQWTCIAHGGAIAGKADILNRMSALFQVMDQRSSSLPSLLLLKGKLDMLDAQLKLRQSSAHRDIENMDSEDDQDIIYVEGQDDVDDPEAEGAPQPSTTAPHTKSTRDTHGLLTEAEDDAIPNGIASISESENDENSDDEAVSDVDNLLDIEAEESTESSGAEESLEEHEADSDDESVGSMDDFIASSNDEDLSDVADGNLSTLPPSKKTKLSGQEKKKPAMRRK